MVPELNPNKLRKEVALNGIDWKQIKEEYPSKPLVGQERALTALEFGIGNKISGFNIYVSGYPGSGKLKAINHFLEEKAKLEAPSVDWCYVNNFKDSYCPKKISLPSGGAEIFKNEIDELIKELQVALNTAFESKEYATKRQEVIDRFKHKEAALFNKIHKKAKANNFAIRITPIEILVLPLDDKGKPLADDKFRRLTKQRQKEILQKQDELKEELMALLRKNRDLEREGKSSLEELDNRVTVYVIESIMEELQEKYKTNKEVLDYLEEVKNDIVGKLSEFLDVSPTKSSLLAPLGKKPIKYQVNIVTNNKESKGAPIVMEFNPTYNNLFGKIEHESHMGTLFTNFTLIRGGSLHKANGGYLVIPLKELLQNYFSWDGLKRALNNREIVIEDAGERFGFLSAKSLKPEPIPLNVQVILIGSPIWYHLLYDWDEDFRELFKVKAEFDTTMGYSLENIRDFSLVTHKIAKEDNLLPLDEKALVAIIEQALRIAQDQNKISIKFREIRDILREANHYAELESKDKITLEYVKKAIEAKYFRSNLMQEKINEMIVRKKLMIDFEGSKIGQINGISIINLGDILFGRPNRITASVASGKEGLMDIEREAKLGGAIHTKGVLILNGYLAEKYAQNKPISFFASLVFEQSYSEVEGDSASSAELYAILSSLSRLPIKQGIAVTGSVNQKGMVQPVGAINEKIEGFFEVCRQIGLNGDQGVIIPVGNEENLMLKQEVVQAVKDNKFHIWAVGTIDEGIEILTGMPAGKPLKDGTYPKKSVHYLVDSRIKELNKNIKQQAESKE